MIYKGFENAWFNCRHLNQNFNQKQRARALVAAACMKVVADCFQMLGTVRTHWTWCSLIWGWWRARQAKARSLMYLMASVTTRSAETFLPIASSIWRSMAIFWNWKKSLRKLHMLFIQIKRSIKTMIVVGFFYYFEKILSKSGSFTQAGVRMLIDFNLYVWKITRYLWMSLALVRILST